MCKVSKRMKYIVQSCLHKKYRLNIVDYASHNKRGHFENLLQTVGRNVETLRISTNFRDNLLCMLKVVENCCYNLKHLRIEGWINPDFSDLQILISRLRSLTLFGCCVNDHRNVLALICRNGHELSALDLVECEKLTSEFGEGQLVLLGKLTHMKHLKLIDNIQSDYTNHIRCIDVHMKHLECLTISYEVTKSTDLRPIASLEQLKRLHLIGYTNGYTNGYGQHRGSYRVEDLMLTLVNQKSTLFELDLHNCQLLDGTYRSIAQLKHIKVLRLDKNFSLAERHMKMMNTLSGGITHFYCFDCTSLTGDGLIHLVQQNKQLYFIDLSWCYLITDETIQMIYSIVSNTDRFQKNGKRFEIIAKGRTKISRAIADSFVNNPLFALILEGSPKYLSCDIRYRSKCDCI